MRTDLSKFQTNGFRPGPKWKIGIWHFINYYIFDSAFPWPYPLKRALLRVFGAKLGKGVIIKIKVRIKYPWKLIIGDHCWIGESVWIDNLEKVVVGNNVAFSQGALVLTGNHDYTDPTFPYRLDSIVIEDGAWIGAKTVVCPGVTCRTHSVLTVNSVATKDLDEWSIYSGNPARRVRPRKMKGLNQPACAQNNRLAVEC